MPTPADVLQAIADGYDQYQYENQSFLMRGLEAAASSLGVLAACPVISSVKSYLMSQPADSQLTSSDALALTNLLKIGLTQVVSDYVQYVRANPTNPDALLDLCWDTSKLLASELHKSHLFHVWDAIMKSFALVSPMITIDFDNLGQQLNNRVIGWEVAVWLYNLQQCNIEITERSLRSLETLRLIMKDSYALEGLTQEQFTTIEALRTSAVPSPGNGSTVGATTVTLPNTPIEVDIELATHNATNFGVI